MASTGEERWKKKRKGGKTKEAKRGREVQMDGRDRTGGDGLESGIVKAVKGERRKSVWWYVSLLMMMLMLMLMQPAI